LKKIHELEVVKARLKQEIFRLSPSPAGEKALEEMGRRGVIYFFGVKFESRRSHDVFSGQ
jgi:hypothetical protein